jgi:heme-degrading monooxygenase HmoA
MVRSPKERECMEKPYTHTTWRVRAGSEDEFVRRWSEWVDWSHREGLEAPALLLRDLENPQAFISFGPWANMAAVRSWRALAGYQERVARLSEVLDSFEPRTLEIVAGARHRGQGNHSRLHAYHCGSRSPLASSALSRSLSRSSSPERLGCSSRSNP